MIIFVAFNAGAFFYLHAGVLLYFIVRVEVIEIQIWFEFKLIQNLEKIWKLKIIYQFFIGHGPNPTQPAQPSLASDSPLARVLRRGQWSPAAAQPMPSLFFTWSPAAAQRPARAWVELIAFMEAWPSQSVHPRSKNPPNPNQRLVQTLTGDRFGVESLLRTIGEQNPYN
jgi:hypothetical protein